MFLEKVFCGVSFVVQKLCSPFHDYLIAVLRALFAIVDLDIEEWLLQILNFSLFLLRELKHPDVISGFDSPKNTENTYYSYGALE